MNPVINHNSKAYCKEIYFTKNSNSSLLYKSGIKAYPLVQSTEILILTGLDKYKFWLSDSASAVNTLK